MPTKKSAPNRAGKKQTSKTGAKKNRVNTKANDKTITQVNPPIVVGGGGSAYIWIKRAMATLVTDLNTIPAGAPHPDTPSLYIVYKVNTNLKTTTVVIGDGSLPKPHSNLDARKHATYFES